MARRALAITALALLLVGGMTTRVDLDVWHLMALARETVRDGGVPLDDRFAYTPTVHPSVQHEWGMGMFLYGIALLGGAGALLGARLVLVLTTCALVWRLAVRRGAREGVLLLLAPAVIMMSWIGWTLIRAQVLTLFFLAVLLTCLDADRRGRRGWMVPWLCGFVVWANCHGGFVVGFAVLGIEALERAVRGERPWHLAAVLMAMAVLVAVNPYGVAYYGYLWGALSMERPLIVEWRPIWSSGPPEIALVGSSLVIALYTLVQVGPRRAPGWPLLVAAAYQAVRHQRHVSLFALIWFAQVPALVSATRLGATLERVYARIGAPVWIVVAVLAASIGVRSQIWCARIPGTEGDPVRYAVGPVARLQVLGFEGNVMVPFVTGAYASWKLHPRVKVSIDSRYEVAYPAETVAEHLAFYDGTPRWRAVLQSTRGTDLVFVPRAAAVAPLMAREPGWTVAYDDDAWIVFARPGLVLPYEDRRGRAIEGTFP
jgi:hypothetical protein